MMHAVGNATLILPAVVGTAALLSGFIALCVERPRPAAGEWFLALGSVFFAAPLAAFGTEHYVIPNTIAALIPAWIPGHIYLAYFVGTSLLLASISIILKRYLRVSAALTSLMFGSFVVLMHVPAAVHHSGNRLFWLIVCRDSTFSLGAFSLFLPVSSWGEQKRIALAKVIRAWTGVVVLVFAVQHFLHPACLPGVPNDRLTPNWVPVPHLITYAVGLVLLIFGILLLSGWRARLASIGVAAIMTALTFGLFLPDAFVNPATTALIGANYFFDTLLFAGALLLIARVMPATQRAERKAPASLSGMASTSG